MSAEQINNSKTMNTETLSTTAPKTAAPAPINFGQAGVRLNSLEDAYRFSKYVCASGWAPKGMDKPEAVLIALQHAAELGLPPLAGLQNIAVINGKPGIYGDAALAIVRNSGLLDPKSYSETEVGTPGKDDFGIKITAARVDGNAQSETFTVADAKTAGLWAKQGPWSQYPKRMLKFRARGFLLRDLFGDVLKGLRTVEELHDMPPEVRNVTRSLDEIVGGKPAQLPDIDLAAPASTTTTTEGETA